VLLQPGFDLFEVSSCILDAVSCGRMLSWATALRISTSAETVNDAMDEYNQPTTPDES
jgi:hypothetical protein